MTTTQLRSRVAFGQLSVAFVPDARGARWEAGKPGDGFKGLVRQGRGMVKVQKEIEVRVVCGGAGASRVLGTEGG